MALNANEKEQLRRELELSPLELSEEQIDDLANDRSVQISDADVQNLGALPPASEGKCKGHRIIKLPFGCGLYYQPPATLTICCGD